MSFLKRRYRFMTVTSIVAIATALSVLAWPVLAQQRPDGGSDDARDGASGEPDVSIQAPVSFSGGAVLTVAGKTEEVAFTTTSSTFVNLPGANVAVFVPANQTDLLLAEFSAETACGSSFTATGQFCQVRLLANGVSMSPTGDSFLTFDSNHPTTQSHSHQWARRVSGGTSGVVYTVQVQVRSSSASSFFIDDWTLTLMRIQ